MPLTSKDLDRIEKLIDRKLDEKIKLLSTKEDLKELEGKIKFLPTKDEFKELEGKIKFLATKDEFKELEEKIKFLATKDEFKELEAKIKFLPTKDEFYVSMDKIMKELSTIREELALTPSFTQVADLEEKVEALERQIHAV